MTQYGILARKLKSKTFMVSEYAKNLGNARGTELAMWIKMKVLESVMEIAFVNLIKLMTVQLLPNGMAASNGI